MKRQILANAAFTLALLSASFSWGQTPPASPMKTTTKISSQIEGRTGLERAQTREPTTSPDYAPAPIKLPDLHEQMAHYFHPGILYLNEGEWEGSDHLLNLSDHIGVYVNLVMPEGDPLVLNSEQVKKEVEAIFTQAKIVPKTLVTEKSPPLPAFELEILIYPVAQGYVACCDGRLFESVILDRFKLDPGMAFQAITWEKSTLIVGPKDTFVDQLKEDVRQIASSFTERYQAYEKLKKQL